MIFTKNKFINKKAFAELKLRKGFGFFVMGEH